MSVRMEQETLSGTCGVRLFYSFDRPYTSSDTSHAHLGGAELGCAGFVDSPACHRAYKELKAQFNIVYQSTPRYNRGSGNQFFFVVYDGKKEK